MSRFKRIRDWPECLKKLDSAKLEEELRYWKSRIALLGHPQAKKWTANRVRDVEREIESRIEDDCP
jgi:hypothetical protein